MSRTKKSRPQTSVQLSDEMIERLDRQVKLLSKDGFDLTRSHVMRMAMVKGLDQMEAAQPKGKR